MKPTSLALITIGLLMGMGISDLAAHRGFPYKKYLLELHHDGSTEHTYACARLSSILGENLSTFNSRTRTQDSCYFTATGTLLPNGDFEGRFGWNTWLGRIRGWSETQLIRADQIKTVSLD